MVQPGQPVNPAATAVRTARRLAKRFLGRRPVSASQLWKQYNINQLQALESALNRSGWSLTQFSSILDFGCGEGRLTQHLCRVASGAEMFGCDIDPQAVGEARRTCSRGQFYANNSEPPLRFADGQFDLVWSYSVFTNISEASHRSWLKELARVLQPGGVMVHTTHSQEYLRRTARFSPECLQKYQFSGEVEEAIRSSNGYYYVSPEYWPPDYGWAIISKEYVETRWPAYTGLSMVGYVEGAIESYPEGCQDIVIMAKDPIQPHF